VRFKVKRLLKLGRDFQNAREGQAAAEFIFAILFLMLLIAGIIESFGMIYTYSSLAAAAKEGVRYAIVHGTGDTTCLAGTNPCTCSGPGNGAITCSDSTSANVSTAVTTYAAASMHNTAAMTITTSYPDSSSAAPNRVRVTISYPYQPFFGLGWPTITVNAAAEGRIFR
jgi:Flp pilus assembly protein TadG